MPRVVIIGAAQHAHVVIDILERDSQVKIVGLVDRHAAAGQTVLGYPVLGRDLELPPLCVQYRLEAAIIAIGDNFIRGQVAARLDEQLPGFPLISAIHPHVNLARGVTIGPGSVLAAGVTVGPQSVIGKLCLLNTHASLDHDSMMGDCSSLGPQAATGGNVQIGEYAAIAIGAVVSHGRTIGAHTVLGAGAVTVRDIPPLVVAYGNPARVIRTRQAGEAYL